MAPKSKECFSSLAPDELVRAHQDYATMSPAEREALLEAVEQAITETTKVHEALLEENKTLKACHPALKWESSIEERGHDPLDPELASKNYQVSLVLVLIDC